MKKSNIILLILGAIVLSGGMGYYIGYDRGVKKVQTKTATISSFAECAAAGYPVVESYPRRCRTPDGSNFIEEMIDESPPGRDGAACTMDAKICPDGTSVGRIPPNCDFAPCPNEPTL